METIDLKGREIESVEYSENELVVKLKPVRFEPKDGDFIVLNYGTEKSYFCFKMQEVKNSIRGYFGISTLGNFYLNDSYPIYNTTIIEPMTYAEKQQLLDALAKAGKTWNAEKKQFEKLRWRAKRGSCYYSISTIGVYGYIDTDTKPDNIRFNLGNYYQTEEQAQAAFEDVKLVYAKNL